MPEEQNGKRGDEQNLEKTGRKPEAEVVGSVWKHPYLLYAIGNAILLAVLVFAGWLAWSHDWIPHR